MTSPSKPGAAWQREPCPSWCTRVHDDLDHPEDRYHQSEPSYLPTISSRRPSIPITASLEAVDMLIRICRYDGDVVTWVAIEALEQPEPRLVLTLESARILGFELAEQLERYDD
jgi:hypothetical protein